MKRSVGGTERTTRDLVMWAESGAMALTGPAEGAPSAGPASLAATAHAAAADLAVQTARWGRRVDIDGPALLGERAAITGMTRNGSVSVGGSARFVRAADGWLALNLPRREDVAALPALVSRSVAPDDWPSIESGLRSMRVVDVVEQATLLGLAVGSPTTEAPPAAPGRELARGPSRKPTATPLVVDLTSLWAGPLAASLLRLGGARVIKVEGRSRPDGARAGAAAFYDLVNTGKECLAIDLRDRDDIGLLRRLIAAADLVIEGSRPRAMDAIGIRPIEIVRSGTSWLSITAHGRTGSEADRVGFGDDAAVAGGVLLAGDPPMFVADAVADPLTGLVAAVYGADILAGDRAAVVEVPLARVAAWAARPHGVAPVRRQGEGWVVEIEGEWAPVAEPRHRPIPPTAPPAGAHSASLRSEFVSRPDPSPG
ncbi:MAG: CoA transferase [Acidimicrobiales bacterium]